ncbi:MAG: enoyl-CoA hydratase/isomerase family protein [Proteobacteria bacterium]|nr:enoyl-CoA hydratase/isomerase family protein [Pseudomonadota bacterium]
MTSLVRYERKDNLGIVTVDHPPVNALNADVRQGLIDALDQGLKDDGVAALVLLGAGRTFIAGADIREFGKPPQEPGLGAVITRYETSAKPVVCAIHGTALGGGLEMALGCHYRVALAAARVGLPEVKLGILPGAGGTQRLPRIVGAEAALQMILSGDFVPAGKAKQMGIIDEVVEGELLAGAAAFAARIVERRPLPRARDLKAPPRADDLFDTTRAELKRSARGLLSPHKIVDAVEAAVTLPFDEGLKRERELFLECLASPQSLGLRHMFFAEREAAKIPDLPAEAPVRAIARAGIVGAGTMGGGIAMCFANAGIPVTVVETNPAALDRGLDVVRRNYAGSVARGRLAQAQMDERMKLITGSLALDAVREADVVVEAVFEDMDVKKDVFRRLDGVVKPGAILATNTSTLDVDEIAATTGRPADVIGLHFFSPANVMRLLEVVRGKATAPDVVATAMKLGRQLGKIGVLVRVCDGFVGNRMILPYMQQAEFLLEEGATTQQVDRVLYDFGLAMGPFTMADQVGLDVFQFIYRRRAQALPKGARISDLLDHIGAQGRFGLKSGSGWYRYEKGSRSPIPDPAIETLIGEEATRRGIQRRPVSDEEILKRCLYVMINEGAKILEEGIALRASDIDVVYCFGYGFPAWRGGPMFYADSVGLKAIYADVERFHALHGHPWQPAALLKRLADSGATFASLAAPAG